MNTNDTEEILLLNKIATILKHIGYATDVKKGMTSNTEVPYRYSKIQKENGRNENIDPFYSGDDLRHECIARRQLDALENYLYREQYDLFIHSAKNVQEPEDEISYHKFRKLQISYCLNLLELNK